MRWELPPRARRILGGLCRCLCCRGTTSACAENTRGSLPLPLLPRNYLRVRGEYAPWMRGLLSPRELPPRARRIRDAETGHFATLGTTSACAENTICDLGGLGFFRNYLRVRGEYPGPTSNASPMRELPPRARRILLEQSGDLQIQGTTSACAENTRSPSPPAPPTRNYLRVRGEYDLGYPQERVHKELPPRARRIRCASIYPTSSLGTTSACAENTSGGGVVPPG